MQAACMYMLTWHVTRTNLLAGGRGTRMRHGLRPAPAPATPHFASEVKSTVLGLVTGITICFTSYGDKLCMQNQDPSIRNYQYHYQWQQAMLSFWQYLLMSGQSFTWAMECSLFGSVWSILLMLMLMLMSSHWAFQCPLFCSFWSILLMSSHGFTWAFQCSLFAAFDLSCSRLAMHFLVLSFLQPFSRLAMPWFHLGFPVSGSFFAAFGLSCSYLAIGFPVLSFCSVWPILLV